MECLNCSPAHRTSARRTTGRGRDPPWWRNATRTRCHVALTTMAQVQAQAAPTRTHLTLKGSTALVHEFFNYSVQSILYQRSIYPSEDFRTVKKFGLQMLSTTDDDLADYLDRAMGQLKTWLEQGKVRRLVVAIVEKETQETVERWQFDIEVVNEGLDASQAYVRKLTQGRSCRCRCAQVRPKDRRAGQGRDCGDHQADHRLVHLFADARGAMYVPVLTQAPSRSSPIPILTSRSRSSGPSRTRGSSPKDRPSR